MKRTALVAGALGAVTLLAACGGGYGYHGAAYAGEADVYYDGFYGDYTDGYWAPEGFYYRGGDGRFIHDEGNHFRHERFNGGRGFHSGHAPAAAPAPAEREPGRP